MYRHQDHDVGYLCQRAKYLQVKDHFVRTLSSERTDTHTPDREHYVDHKSGR